MKAILRSIPALAVAALVLAWVGNAHGQSSANHQITRSVMSGGGGRSSSASYSLTGTFGQPSPVEASESGSYNLGSGFWGATVRLFTVAIEDISYSIAEGVRISWRSVMDATYTVEYADALSFSTLWNAVSQQVVGTGSLMEWFDDGTETGSHPGEEGVLKRFYRLMGQP
jgi:hypothetical protein